MEIFLQLQAQVCTQVWHDQKILVPHCLETFYTISKFTTVNEGGRDSCFPGLDATAVLPPYIT